MEAETMEIICLRNGEKIPVIGFGPDELGYTPRRKEIKQDIVHRGFRKVKKIIYDEPKYIREVSSGFKAGFRLLDWSASYGDGKLLAKSIKKSGISRDEYIITTRISNQAQFNGSIREEFYKQLKTFNIDYFDILMFHWPVTGYYEKTWEEMNKIKDEGLCKILGVANCHQKHLENLFRISGEYPEINQVEIHPLFTQIPLRKFCNERNIQIEAYSPTARLDDRLCNPPLLKNFSKKYNKNITQIILRWHIQNGIIPIIRSLNYSHQLEDMDIFDFTINEEDMIKIDALNINSRIRYDPDNCDFSCL